MDADKVQLELEAAVRTINVSNQLDFADWDIDFLLDYVVNVHHHYLKKTLPQTKILLSEFAKEHAKKFPWLTELEAKFNELVEHLLPVAKQEEEVIFPYIRRLAHANEDKEPYAAMLIRTMRKPVEETMFNSHETVTEIVLSIRDITNKYYTPENVCISHKVVLAKLKELDNDLMQHLYLEQSVLFPRAMAIEKQILDI